MQEFKDILREAISELYGVSDFEPEVTEAPANIEADFSSNAPLKLAKILHKSPMEIGGELVSMLLRDAPSRPSLRGSVATFVARRHKSPSEVCFTSSPGFVNLVLPGEYYAEKMAEFETKRGGEFEGKTVVCEFSDPNPFKVLHVGHLYTSIMGDAISRLYEAAGAKVVRANFGGDVGLHVAKTMYILKQKKIDDLTVDDIARCYVEGTAAYEDDEGARAEITELNKEIYKINAENLHDSELSELYWKGRELSYEYFKEFYARIGVEFDKYYPESSVAGLGLSQVQEELANGVYEKSGGAVIFNGEKFGLHTRVFINSEGVPTYETKDVGLIFQKWADYHFDRSVVITGNEQKDYMGVVLKSVEQYAPELVSKTRHLTHGLVKLPGNVKMSSRKGNFLKAVDVLDLVSEELYSEYGSKDEKVALAAVKYAFVKYRMGGDIIFDPKESVKMTGNSGPYLLYSCVRAAKVLEAGTRASSGRSLGPVVTGLGRYVCGPSPQKSLRTSYSSFEKALVKKLLGYNEVLKEAVKEMAPHKVAGYLYELAQEFSRFYENCPVVGSEEEEKRLYLVSKYLEVMKDGLRILGITEIPEEM